MCAVAAAQQGVGMGFVWGQMAGQFEGLVVATFTQASAGERHGDHKAGCLQRGFDPRRMAHEIGQGAGEARVGLKFEACNAVCPGKGVAHSGDASV